MPLIVQLSLFDSKQCSRCHQWRPRTEYRSAKKTRDGLYAWCNPCSLEYRREWAKANPERQRAAKQREYSRHADKYREYRQQYYRENKERVDEHNRRAYHENREARREYSRQYYAKNRDRLGRINRQYYAAHRVELTAWHREHYRQNKEAYHQRATRWRVANRLACRLIWHRRRARERNAEGSHTVREWYALLEWFGSKCLACGSHESLTIDHVIPLSCGGSNRIDNLQPLCHSCNSAKSASTVDYRDAAMLAAFLASH